MEGFYRKGFFPLIHRESKPSSTSLNFMTIWLRLW